MGSQIFFQSFSLQKIGFPFSPLHTQLSPRKRCFTRKANGRAGGLAQVVECLPSKPSVQTPVSPKESLFEASLVKKNPSSRKEIKKKKKKLGVVWRTSHLGSIQACLGKKREAVPEK
jgi:hypothetical protein